MRALCQGKPKPAPTNRIDNRIKCTRNLTTEPSGCIENQFARGYHCFTTPFRAPATRIAESMSASSRTVCLLGMSSQLSSTQCTFLYVVDISFCFFIFVFFILHGLYSRFHTGNILNWKTKTVKCLRARVPGSLGYVRTF